MARRPRRAVFLDRDGVLIEEMDYLSDARRMRLIPGAAAALRRLARAGFRNVLITNQSGVGRGLFTLASMRAVHRRLRAQLRARGARLDAIYYCPHHPESGCRCRKPKTAMIAAAARRLRLDVPRSFFIGDSSTDMQTALNAGCAGLLVRTGKAGRDRRYKARPARAFRDVAAAAAWIVSRKEDS